MAQEHKVVAIALLRPGYWDSDGRRSFGSHNAHHDHYTARNNELLAKTIANLKKENGFSRVVAVGHSGGAAQIGAVIGQYPGLVDVAILAACPCDIKRWRKDRGSEWPNSEPQSPSNFVEKVDRSTTVTALTGTNDIVTKAYLADEYVDSLRNVGINANFLSVPGGEHKFSTIADAVVQQIEFHLGED
jgi:predicted esterase